MVIRKLQSAGGKTARSIVIGSTIAATAIGTIGAMTDAARAEFFLGESRGSTKINDEPTKFFTTGDIPERPALLLELGDAFLGEGNLGQGFELPTGAVWSPALWVFGTLRSAIQTVDTGIGDSERLTDWANRFDFFANLQLTATEKIVLGIRPLDKNRGGQFSGYRFEGEANGDDEGFLDFTNGNIRTLFAEGDLGSLFPVLDKQGTTWLDYGFTVGRQPLIFQDGILLNDTQDAVGLVRNNVRLPGVSNLRVSGLWSWDSVSRGANLINNTGEDEGDLQQFGLFTAFDTEFKTTNVDLVYTLDTDDDSVVEDGDSLHAGISIAERIGRYSVTWRANGSLALEEESDLVTDGALLSTELSWTPHGSDDTIWINPFVSLGNFSQAGRENVDGGGPLAPIGILFASPNLGGFGSELDNKANDNFGAAIGYQAFWNDHWTNLGLEIAGFKDLGLEDQLQEGFEWQVGVGFQAQQKVTQQSLVQLEAFYALQEGEGDFDVDDNAYGGRLEFLYQF
ncbi:MAG: hypothetical protein ACR2RF_30950 [Geminicoccaceae bacterium]